MEWALLNKPGVNNLVEYETRLNYVLPKYNDAVICTYDLTKFPASLVMDIMRTHPVVIIGGIFHENPFCVSSDQLPLLILVQQSHRNSAATANCRPARPPAN